MFYILDDLGYIEAVSSHFIECFNKTCTEYTGAIPEGYETLDDWILNANIRAYKLDADGNLIFDEIRDAELQEEYAEKPNEVLLYENEAGSSAAITLSETAANFKYIEIFCKSNDNTYTSVKVYKPDGKRVSIVSGWFATSSYFKNAVLNISANKISFGGFAASEITASNKCNTANNTAAISIIRVIGYREGV